MSGQIAKNALKTNVLVKILSSGEYRITALLNVQKSNKGWIGNRHLWPEEPVVWDDDGETELFCDLLEIGSKLLHYFTFFHNCFIAEIYVLHILLFFNSLLPMRRAYEF